MSDTENKAAKLGKIVLRLAKRRASERFIKAQNLVAANDVAVLSATALETEGETFEDFFKCLSDELDADAE